MEPRESSFVLGQRSSLATLALTLALLSFLNLAGMEKAILAIVLGLRALKPTPPAGARTASRLGADGDRARRRPCRAGRHRDSAEPRPAVRIARRVAGDVRPALSRAFDVGQDVSLFAVAEYRGKISPTN